MSAAGRSNLDDGGGGRGRGGWTFLACFQAPDASLYFHSHLRNVRTMIVLSSLCLSRRLLSFRSPFCISLLNLSAGARAIQRLTRSFALFINGIRFDEIARVIDNNQVDSCVCVCVWGSGHQPLEMYSVFE